MVASEDIHGLVGREPLGRRGFVAASLAGGFAASVAPVGALRARTIVTDDARLVSEEVLITTADGRLMPAWRAQPAGARGMATVLGVHEDFGVHEHRPQGHRSSDRHRRPDVSTHALRPHG